MSSWLARGSTPSPLQPSKQQLNPNQQAGSNDQSSKMQIDGLAPTFQKKPTIRNEEAGKKLVFECLVEAEPEPVVKWFHNGQPLLASSRLTFDMKKEGDKLYKASLEIKDITIELAGQYTINCKNNSGESSAKISLNFDSEEKSEPLDGCKPSFLERPVIKQSSDFKHVQFDCRLMAEPKPDIQWLHAGKPLAQSSKLETMLIPVQSTGAASKWPTYLATLVLKEVDPNKTGDYRCVASNKHGSNYASINLNFVQGKPKIPDGRAPKFPRKPVIKQVAQTLTIECVVEANPKPTITWYHDSDTIIREDSRHSHLTWSSRGPITSESELRALGVLDGDEAFPATSGRTSFSSSRRSSSASARRDIYVVSLEIRQPKASDGGTYRCNAVNELGESSANIALNFQTNQQKKKDKLEEEAEQKENREEVKKQKKTDKTRAEREELERLEKLEEERKSVKDGSIASETSLSEATTLKSAQQEQHLHKSQQQQQQQQQQQRRDSAESLSSQAPASRRQSRQLTATNAQQSSNEVLNSLQAARRTSSIKSLRGQNQDNYDNQSVASTRKSSNASTTSEAASQSQSQLAGASTGRSSGKRDSLAVPMEVDSGVGVGVAGASDAGAGRRESGASRRTSASGAAGAPGGAGAGSGARASDPAPPANSAGSSTNRLSRDSTMQQAATTTTATGDAAKPPALNNGRGGGAEQEQQQQQEMLDQLPPVKRTSSTSSAKRTTSVKKKRPSLLGAPDEPAAGAPGGPAGEPAEGGAKVKRLVKKRVSVKRDASGLMDIAEGKPLERRDSASSVASSVASSRRADRLPSVSVEVPKVVEPAQQDRPRRTLSGRAAAAAASIPTINAEQVQPGAESQPQKLAPRLSVSDASQDNRPAGQPSATGGAPQRQDSQKRRGNYEGLRGEDPLTEDQEDAEAKRRYLATRGGGGQQARESLSPTGSRSPTRQGSIQADGRRGSSLLTPEGLADSRRPSIILSGDNKLRPGEIADRRRRSSIDMRRASAVEVEAADKPSTPLNPCGKKPAIIDFQDSVSGTENHTSLLTFGIEGDPVPTLRFFKGDTEIYEGGRYTIVTDGKTNTVHFCIRKSKPMDEARYKVVATNEHGEDSAFIQLFVSDESGMDYRAMLRHRQYAKWKKEQEDPNWGNLKAVEEEKLAQIKEPKRPDNFIKPLQNQKVKQGRDLKVRFECVFSKSGVKAKWFRNNKEIFPNKKFHLTSTGDLHVLEIEGPYVEDAGKITCQCLDTKCSAMLEVEEPDPVYKFVKLLSKGYGQYLNRELTLETSCNSFKAQVHWYKDDPKCVNEPLRETRGKYAFEMDKFGKKILRIQNCQFEDSGQYTCKIINTPKDEVTTTQVQISEKKFQFMKPLYSQRATEDDKIVLECEVDEPDAPVKWYRKDRATGQWKELKPEQLKHKEIIVEGKKRRLIIKKAKCQDEGEYKCCTNADETACELFVEPSNKWRKKLVDVTVIEDEPLVLEIELMERKPGVALVWNRNRKEVGCQGGAMQTTADERINFKTVDDKMTMTIERAKMSDAGDWSVNYDKMKCACKVQVLPAEKAPAMRFPSNLISAEVGKPLTVEIPYQVGGTKQSAVVPKLLCNGQPVSAGKVDIVVKDDKIIMKFKDPQRSDANDNYEFVLENAKGKQAEKFKLEVQGPPGTPEGPLKISDVFKDKCKLNWEPPLDNGGCPIAHYIVERQEVGSGRTTWTECGITSTTQLDVNDLSPKKEYKFRVRAVNKKGKSEPLVAAKSVLAKDPYDPPSEPENLVVTNWDKDFVDLEWEAPLKDGGVPVESYVIEAKSKFAPDWVAVKQVPASQGCKAKVTENLKENSQMQFRVRAANKMGQGEPSKPTKPVIIKARFVKPYIAGDGLKNIVVKKGRPVRYEINFNAEPPPEITWIANDQELKCLPGKCEIERLDKKTILLVTDTTRADSGRYKLMLKNSCGQVVSEADVVVLDRPSPPQGPLVMEEVKSDQVTIKWRKPKDTGGEPIEGYVIEKMNLETGRWVPAGECGPQAEMFTVQNLMKGKKYKFRVRAKNKEGESEALETKNVLDVGEEPTIQKCPSKVTVGQGETAKVKIHFQGEPSEFKIVNMDTGEVVTESGTAGAAGANKPKYTVFDDYLTITIPDAHKDKDAGRYKVELKNNQGSNEATFDLDVTGPPGAPQGPLETGEVTENSVQLSWRPPADDGGERVTHYIVERRDTSQGADAWIEVTGNCKDTNFNVTGLTKDNAYEFRVMAVNENGQSKPLVSETSVVAKLPYDPPSAPGKPEATPVSEDSVQLEWERPKSDGGSRITGYFIEKREVGSDTWQKVNPNAPVLVTEFTVKNLIEDRKYEFRVVAQNAAGLSEPSECSAQTLVKDPNASDVPKFVKPLKKVVGTENGSFELECIVQGHPPPNVVWSKGAKELRDGGKYCMTQESGPDGTTIHRLLVSRAAGEDADEYSIKATNKAGSRTSRCDVEIQTKPKIKVPPQFAGDNPVTFDRGESIQLKIPFTGNPPPTVRWFKGDEEIEPSAQFDIETDDRHTTLTIRDATREDSGEYRLVVSNKLGEDSASFNVSVADRPEPPRFPMVSDVADDAATITWKAPLWDGGSHITQYIIEKRELPMTSWIRAATTRFLSQQVVNLNEEKEYEFRVFAENIYGRSEPSEIVKCATKQSGRKKQRTNWPLDKDGKKIRSQNGNDIPDDYDRFVKDGPVNHAAADIKTCPITDNYEILEKIGDGIFGEVYRVREKATGDYYAAKFTPVNTAEEKALLKKEIDTINQLHHKNILRLHDAYEDDDEMVTVHEFIAGKEVFEKICEPGYQMTEEQVRKYMRDVCEAVRHMHDRNVIHLDLKPENLVLQSKNPLNPSHEPKVKIVDFGLACKLDPHEICKISTMAADYAAPEILEKDSVGFYTDMWAIGVLTHVLLSGKTPFDSQADIKAGQWSFDETLFSKVSPEGRDFIEKLLVRQKEKRMTAHECLEHPWLKEEGDEATRKMRREPLVAETAFRRERDAMKRRYLDWWDKSILSIGHISNYSPLRKLYADRYKIFDALLDRRELAPRFVIKPQSTFAYEGQSARFFALITSDSPFTVSWFKENRELKQSVKYMKRYALDNNFNFIVNRCKMSDFGEYVIRAENHHGGREEPVFLDVRKRPVDFTPVHLEPMKRRREPEPPKFEEEPDCPPKFNFLLRPRIIQSGLSVKLICCLKGKPAPAITWTKDGRELSKRDYTMKHSDGVCTLEIAACDTSHTGKYTCHAQNALGEDKTTADVLIEGKRTFTPVPIAGLTSRAGDYPASPPATPAPRLYQGRHQRSASLSRGSSPTPPPHISLSSTLQAVDLNLPRARDSRYLSATLYSPNYSINTNRYLRRSYKGPMVSFAGSTSGSGGLAAAPTTVSSSLHASAPTAGGATGSHLASVPSGRHLSRTISRFARPPSRIPTYTSRRPMRTLSSYGRSSSSLH